MRVCVCACPRTAHPADARITPAPALQFLAIYIIYKCVLLVVLLVVLYVVLLGVLLPYCILLKGSALRVRFVVSLGVWLAVRLIVS